MLFQLLQPVQAGDVSVIMPSPGCSVIPGPGLVHLSLCVLVQSGEGSVAQGVDLVVIPDVDAGLDWFSGVLRLTGLPAGPLGPGLHRLLSCATGCLVFGEV